MSRQVSGLIKFSNAQKYLSLHRVPVRKTLHPGLSAKAGTEKAGYGPSPCPYRWVNQVKIYMLTNWKPVVHFPVTFYSANN